MDLIVILYIYGVFGYSGDVKPVSLPKHFYWAGLVLKGVNQYLCTVFGQN